MSPCLMDSICYVCGGDASVVMRERERDFLYADGAGEEVEGAVALGCISGWRLNTCWSLRVAVASPSPTSAAADGWMDGGVPAPSDP